LFLSKFLFEIILYLDETPPPIPMPTIESSPIIKPETVTRRIAIPSDIESSNEKKDLSDNKTNNLSSTKSTTRSIITNSPKTNQEEITTTQSRLVINRNVVIGEPATISSRTIVQTNRVVVSSDSMKSLSKGKKNDADLVEQENQTKKFKPDSQSSK
jgi:hypothetical protein